MKGEIQRRSVDKLKLTGGWLNDTEIPGFAARRLPSGRVQYLLRYQVDGKRRFMPLGLDGEVLPEDARKLASGRRVEVRAGRDPAAEREAEQRRAKDTLKKIAEDYLNLDAKKRLRTADEVERIFKVYVYPKLGDRPVEDVTRRDVAELLDGIETGNGPVMADRVLAAVRRLLNWHAARTDHFASPVVRGMARTKPKERARDRVLTAAEIRKLWPALDQARPAIFGPLIKMLFYTAQRRGEVAGMAWADIAGTNWVIPAAKYKTKRAVTVPLSEAAQAVLRGVKRHGPFVFTTDGKTAFGGFTKAKRELDRDAKVTGWVLHDIRRSSRSAMSAAGVAPDVAERVLGHVIAGVAGVYDRHDYVDQKRAALTALADRIAAILKGEVEGEVKKFARQRRTASVGTG